MENRIPHNEMLRFYGSEYYQRKYLEERNQPEHLFRSERHFLERIIKLNMSVLDIGCACGGFYNILRKMSPDIKYTGIDISPPLLEAARQRYPEATFLLLDAADGLPFEPFQFDLVFTLGVVLHEPRYRGILKNAYAVAKHYLLYDVHIQKEGKETLDINTAYVINQAGTRNHYIVIPYNEVATFPQRLTPSPIRVEIFGYMSYIKGNKNVILPGNPDTICTATVLVERGADEPSEKGEILIQLPDEALLESVG